ncbi:Superfamily II DNA and RNA helicase [Micromonospora echinospora]|uniref:Superfamily II DNA and RNA helicase n=1 Tax=Micromonospora echinospora TaxID=1877 RepID=A0A1C4XGV1_MICEC|nr:DEAD/DEAH box helicase [Micromonospora echinospora]SCF07703.1 Superfamily II DNA and RNA helicase [Micromonospora echinospora]
MTTVIPSFADIGLRSELLAELSAQGIDRPFPIQAATLPDSLAGRDVLGRGRTGSGKTLAFGLPTLHRTAGHRARPGRPKALVLVPTRELAQQVTTALTPYAKALGLRCVTVVGGLSLQRQADALRAGAEVVVATPGRLHDLIDRGDVRLNEVQVTVLDEADRMADMGFLPQVTKLLEQVAPDGQRMLFSATLDGGVDRLVRRFLTNPVSHSVDPGTATVTAMTHHVLHVDADDKPGTLAQIAAREGRTIMFMGTKHRADRLARQLLARGVRAAALHGGKSQPQRTRILEQFKTGAVTALIATDVAARGIHVDGLDLVVNVDPPTEAKDYLHRGGRTARAGESGTVVTLVLPEQRRDVVKLMSVAGIKPHVVAVRPGDEVLVRVTGAREPSGVPVTIPVPAAATRVATPARTGGGSGATDAKAPAGGRSPHRSSGRSRRSRRPRAS